MTEHPVYLRATGYLADLEHREVLALRALSEVRGERQRTEDFLEMYRHFAGGPIDPVDEPDFEQSTNPDRESPPETTPPAKTSNAEREGGNSSAPIPEAPKPLPVDQGHSAAVSITQEQRPAEAKTSDQEPFGSGQAKILPTTPEPPNLAHADPQRSDGPAREDGRAAAPGPIDQVRAVLVRQIASKPERPTLATRVIGLHGEHPDWSQKQVAEALGVGTGSVANAIKGKGLEFVKEPASKPKDDSKRAKVEAYIKGHPDATAKELSDALGVSDATIRAIAFTHNLNIRKLSPEELATARRAGAMKALKLRTGGAEFLKDKIIGCNREHPDWDTHQLAEACGTTAQKVSAYKSQYSIPIPTKAVEPKLGGARKFVREENPVPVVERRPAPPPAERQPAPAPPVDDGAESYRRKYGAERPSTEIVVTEEIVSPTVAKFGSPNAKWFRLKRADGMWLHMTGVGFTAEKNDSWIGKIGQLRAACERFEDAKGLQIVGVTVAK